MCGSEDGCDFDNERDGEYKGDGTDLEIGHPKQIGKGDKFRFP